MYAITLRLYQATSSQSNVKIDPEAFLKIDPGQINVNFASAANFAT
jgi:hypothetical protein